MKSRHCLSMAVLCAIASMPLSSTLQLVAPGINSLTEAETLNQGKHIENQEQLQQILDRNVVIDDPYSYPVVAATELEPVGPPQSPFVQIGRFPFHGAGTSTPSRPRGIGSASRRGIAGVRKRKAGRKS